MATLPFAGKGPQPSFWGYNWSTENATAHQPKTATTAPHLQASNERSNGFANDCQKESTLPGQCYESSEQYKNLPAALLSSLKREKKPFTYTPGGVDLSDVLNARLQKRLERKKKLWMEKAQAMAEQQTNQTNDMPVFEPTKQVLVAPTYNTPINMYSVENALEALEVQAELTVAEKSLSSPTRSKTLPRNHTFKFQEQDYEPKNVTQSKAFRVLQIITDTEEEAPPTGVKNYQYQDETRFTGIRDNKVIPSKFFHNLQRITGTAEDDNSSAEECNQEVKYTGAICSTFTGEPKENFSSKNPQRTQQQLVNNLLAIKNQQNYVANTQPQFQHHHQDYNTSQQQLQNPQNNLLAIHKQYNQPSITDMTFRHQYQQNNTGQDSHRSSPVLRRPADFLPSQKYAMTSRFKSFHAPANGPKAVNPREGTDL